MDEPCNKCLENKKKDLYIIEEIYKKIMTETKNGTKYFQEHKYSFSEGRISALKEILNFILNEK